MYGNILYGGCKYADTNFGVYIAEVSIDISVDSKGIIFRPIAVLSSYPSVHTRIPALDMVINLGSSLYKNIPSLGLGAYGGFDEFGTTIYAGFSIGSYSDISISQLIITGPARIGIRHEFEIEQTHPNMNAFKWSKIGELDFTVDQTNIAGEAPLPWNGYTYQIEQLGNSGKLIIYGVNGISLITPNGIHMGQSQISSIGIKSKHSMIATDGGHYFILTNGKMFSLNENGKKQLGFENLFYSMSNIVMSWDEFNNLIYICDGTIGYIYDIESGNMSSGPSDITGVMYKDGDLLISSDSTVILEIPNIATGVYDFGTRKDKTIFGLEVGTDYDGTLEASISYRQGPKESFSQLPWKTINPDGRIDYPCVGKEFKFHIRATTTGESFTIELLKINGVIHGFSHLDV